MSDSAEIFNAMRERDTERRHRNLRIAEDRFNELPKETRKFTDWHWGIPTKYGMHIDYWPTKNKWRDPKTGRYIHGDFDSLLGYVRKRQ